MREAFGTAIADLLDAVVASQESLAIPAPIIPSQRRDLSSQSQRFRVDRKLLQVRIPNRNFRPARLDSTGGAGNFPQRDSLLKEILPLQLLQTWQLVHCPAKNRNSRHRA